ncbi:uncharacterized protein LOC124269568 [Haliotis rubra]|uniref:uncharacterized protein LOC124269568 n=1 Tax=Haliotis rubra TaxID=36100 RepID=UPI001EE4FC78|nr:uncharacterized protein LOC124269568 [Haliotis rubra]
MCQLMDHYSSWYRLKRAVVIYHRLFDILHSRKLQTNKSSCGRFNQPFTVQELDRAENVILKFIQLQHFDKEMDSSSKRCRVPKSSSVYRLDLFLDNGLLKVGGRLSRAEIPEEMKYPVLLPYKSVVTSLIITDIHLRLGHAGRNHVLSALREKYWVIKANSAVRTILSRCVTCRKLRVPACEQKMADLPSIRVKPTPPFTYTGVDFFGPHVIKEGRKYAKRYGALFTCLVSRGVHIETANSLDTDSFLHALRRFIARRGPIHVIWCDNSTNFTSAAKELRQAVAEMSQERIQSYLLKSNIEWKFNPPSASHMGGVWERLIRSVRQVLSPLLNEFGERLNDESYRTLLCEVEAIINSRPLTTVSDSPDDLNPLSPNHLLMMKSNVSIPPPGHFQRNDVYMRRRWRRIQYLANVFWSRWRREYLLNLQVRQKWNESKRNMQVDDIVLIMDQNIPRLQWPMGRVIATESDKRGHVRSVVLRTLKGELRRPVHKLVLLLTSSE